MTSDTPEQPKPGGLEPIEPTAEPGAWGDDALRSQHLDLDTLSAFLDQGLEPEEMAAARAHLATCPECGQELAELRATVALLRELPQYAPRRTFQLGPEHARGATRGGIDLGGWFERLLPLFPALRIATVAVAVLLVAVIAGDLVSNRGAAPVTVLESGGDTVEETSAPESLPAPAPAIQAPADREAAPRSAAFQPTMAAVEDAASLAESSAESAADTGAGAGTESEVPASMERGDTAEDAPGVVAPPPAEPEPASSPPSGWRLIQVGLGLALLWLIVSLVGIARIRRDHDQS